LLLLRLIDYGLRDYGTARWEGGDHDCDHNPQRADGGDRGDRTLPLGRGGVYKDVCGKCGAVRVDSQIGLEETPDEYVANMVQVFREVWRVMRDDGTLFLNLGDSYFSGSQRVSVYDNGGKEQLNYQEHGCLCENLCGVCRAAYQNRTSRKDGLLVSMLIASLSLTTRVSKELQSDHLPTSDLIRQVDRIFHAIPHLLHIQAHEYERLLSFRESMPDEFYRQLLGVCLQRANHGLCLLCARSLEGDAQAFSHKLGDLPGQFSHNRDTSLLGDQQERYNQCTDTACVCYNDDFPYPYYTTEYHLKPKDLIGIPWRVAFALQADGWYLRQDIIWCLSGGAKVYAKTQKTEGPMLVKDLVRLDPSTVYLWNGEKWTQVLGFSENKRPENPLEIVLRSGERIGCTPEHKWPTQRGLLQAGDLRVGDVIDSCLLPDSTESPEYIPDDIGWFVGMYIAEGSMSGNTIQISSHIKETSRYERIKELAEKYGGTAQWYSYTGDGAVINVHCPMLRTILDLYVSGRIAKDKRLNPSAWKRSNLFIKNVLSGYLEGDGHKDGERWRLGFTRNYEWEQDLRTICARLGYQLRLKPSKVRYKDGFSQTFRGEIRFNPSEHHNVRNDTEIVEIRRSRARRFYDIGVVDEPHLFALASGVLTHNSKPNPMPESVKDRCTKAHEYIFLLTKSARYWYDNEAIVEEANYDGRKDEQFKGAVKSYDGVMPDGQPQSFAQNGHARWQKNEDGVRVRNKRSVWTVNTKPHAFAHFAVYPEELIEPCILAGCPEGGTVLDPFSGSGTTGRVAIRNRRQYVGLELNPEYITIQRERLTTEVRLI